MVIPTAAIAAALTLAPPTPIAAQAVEFDASDVEVTRGPDSMHVATFDGDGEQSGEVVIWSDGNSPIRLDATFADGLYLVAHVNGDGEILEIESPDGGEAVRRMVTIADVAELVSPDDTKSEAMCYAGLVGAAACVTGNVIACMVAGFIISCNCLEIVNETPTPGCE